MNAYLIVVSIIAIAATVSTMVLTIIAAEAIERLDQERAKTRALRRALEAIDEAQEPTIYPIRIYRN